MPQGPLTANVSVQAGAYKPLKQDSTGNLNSQNGGVSSALNLTAAGVIKASPGRLRKIVIIAPGTTSGAFTFNDATTTAGAAAANEIFTLPYNGTANVPGYVITLDWPCANGIVLSAVPGAGSPIVAASFD